MVLHNVVNQVHHMLMDVCAFLDYLLNLAAKNSPVFLVQILGSQHNDRI